MPEMTRPGDGGSPRPAPTVFRDVNPPYALAAVTGVLFVGIASVLAGLVALVAAAVLLAVFARRSTELTDSGVVVRDGRQCVEVPWTRITAIEPGRTVPRALVDTGRHLPLYGVVGRRVDVVHQRFAASR